MLSKLQLFLFALLFLGGFFIKDISQAYADSFDDQVVSLINSERQKQNLASLNNSSKLFQSAQKHNNTMSLCAKTYGVTSCFKHTVTLLDEPTLLNRIKATGYNPQSVAENIAWGYTTPSSVVTGWMNSSGHRANILGSYKDVGCDYLDSLSSSYKGMYWTCDFGKSLSTTSSSTPTPTPTKTFTNPTPTPTITVSNITSTSTSKPWWCVYAPTHEMCK